MKLLLDTHVFLWWLGDHPSLWPRARELITDPKNLVFISAVSTWEIAIKKALGKLDAPSDLGLAIEYSRFTPLPITITHSLEVENLPPHHQDPFDRLLIAQARVENHRLVTKDKCFLKYDLKLIHS